MKLTRQNQTLKKVNFHTGLLVVKPDKEEFEKLKTALSHTSSYDGADQGFLTNYYSDLKGAPLFNASSETVSESPLERLQINYNMHHIYYYEHFSWRLYQDDHFNTSFPMATIGYPISPWLKVCFQLLLIVLTVLSLFLKWE